MIAKAGSHANDYRSSIRSAIRGLWSGAIGREQFMDAMGAAIDRGLRLAFAEGAKGCGVLPDEFSEEEQAAIQDAILSEFEHTGALADAVEAGSKANGGKLDPLNQRGEAWIVRYLDLVNRGKAMACGDKKFRWVMGPTKEHCTTCNRLSGQVRRGSFWRDHVLPQNPPNEKLECLGFRCRCSLQQTDDPASRGRLPI